MADIITNKYRSVWREKKKKSHTDLYTNSSCFFWYINVKSKNIWLNKLDGFSMVIFVNK